MHKLVFLTLAALAVGLAPAPTRAQPTVPLESVILCEHPDFAGYCEQHTLEPGMRHLLVRWPDKLRKKVSSIAVGYEVKVWVFEEVEFCGAATVVSGSLDDLSRSIYIYPYPWSRFSEHTRQENWNDRLSSFIVYRRGQEPEGVLALTWDATKSWAPLGAFDRCPSKFLPMPESIHLPRRSFDTVFDIANRAKWLRISPTVEVVLFDRVQKQGASLKLPGLAEAKYKGLRTNWYSLDRYQFADRAESLEVRRRGWTPAMEPPQRDTPGDPVRHRAPPAAAPVQMIEVEAMRSGPQDPSVVAPGRPVERAAGSVSREPDSNRPGHDYKSFPIPDGDADTCRTACAEEAACRAYTFVRPGGQGAPGHCWLKSAVSPPQPDACCVSGVKQ